MEKKYIIGIDLGGTNLKLALFDLKYKIKDKIALNTALYKKKETLISAIVNAVNGFTKKHLLKNKNLLGLGLGVPGPVDAQKGIVHFFPNIPGWKEVNLKNILQKRLRLPIFLDNDANLMALAEARMGSAKSYKYAVCLTLGTGVGAGIIIGGKIYRGMANLAGELGHLPLNIKGPLCNCGGRACLESYIGNRRILELAKDSFKRKISLEELSELAKKNNKKALKIWLKVAEYLGVALSGVINLLNPDCIVIGGGVANAGKVLFKQVKRTILKRAMPNQARQVKIYKAKLGSDAGLIGAAIMVKEGLGR